jgi:cytochrome P450
MISFGMRTNLSGDPLIAKGLELAMEFMALTGQHYLTSSSYYILSDSSKFMTGPLANAVDFFEPLQWIPTSKRSRARKLHDDFIEVYGSMIRRFKNLMNSGEEVPDCLMKTLLESQEDEKLEWEDICMISAVFTLGGVHSVSGTLSCILMVISRKKSPDIWHHPMVSRFDTLSPTCRGESL